MEAPLLWRCSVCWRPCLLAGHVKGWAICTGCWLDKGCPLADPLGEIHVIEEQTRERMTARGGTGRHLVRNGRT